jgi:capsular polysaccharide biosynthesis protein
MLNALEVIMELELKDYIRIVKKRLWLIASIVLLSCIVTGVFSYFFIQPVYEASTKLIVNKTSERVGIDQVDINTVNLNLRLIDTYKEIIKTPAIMDKVVEANPSFQLTADELIKKVKVSSVNNTQVMTLIVQDESYEKAVLMVNEVSRVFKSEIPSIMKVDNVSLLNEAKLIENPVPVKPNPKLNIAISLVVSLMVAVGLIFLLEYMDDTIKSDSDVEQFLGLPTLAMISRISEEDLGSEKAQITRQVGETRNVPINE